VKLTRSAKCASVLRKAVQDNRFMSQSDENGGSALHDILDELLDRGIFRLIAFLAGAAFVWWLRSR
jgi:hypothetical protein